MITKYIGSADEFLDCESVAFVNVLDNYVLVESDISQYYTTNSLFSKVKLVSRDENGIFTAVFSESERVNFVVNYLIMYNSLGDPIGFCNLTQNIDLIKYDIETITLSFDYTVVNKTIYINVKISYQSHLIRTRQKLAHSELFNNPQGKKAVNKSSIVSTLSTTKLFTNNLLEVCRDPNLIYRYSGNISKSFDRFLTNYIELNLSDFSKSKYIEIILKNNIEYILSYDGTNLTITAPNYHKSYEMAIDSSLHIGSNFILANSGDGYKLYPTDDLLNGNFTPIKTNTMEYNDSEVSLNKEDLILTDIRVVKNPITKNLMLYKLTEEGLETNDKELQNILDFFGIVRITDQFPIYAADGLLFMVRYGKDEDGSTINEYSWATYSLPGNFTSNGLENRFDTITYFSGSDVNQGTNDESNKQLASQFKEITKNVELQDLVFITPELLLVNSDKKYLLSIDAVFNYVPVIYNFEYKLNMMLLSGITGLKNYDKLFKSQIPDMDKITISRLAISGNIYGYMQIGNRIRLYRL